MPTPLDIARRRLAAASDDRSRCVAALAVALLSIPAASPLPLANLARGRGGGGEAGGLESPARVFSSFDSLPGLSHPASKGTLERV